MPVVNPRVPEGLRDLMKGLTKEVLREKPPNIYEFSAHYFETLLQENKDFIVKEYEPVISYENIFQAKERNQIPVALVFKIIPEGLTELIKEFIKAVLRENPKNLCEFAVNYFRHIRTVGNIKNGTIQYTAYENYFNSNERFVFTPYVKCTCGRTFGEGLAQSKEINKNQFKKKDIQNGKAKPPIQKSLPKISAVSAIKLESSKNVDVKDEPPALKLVHSVEIETMEITKIYDERYITAIYVIQRFFKRCLKKQAAEASKDKLSKQDGESFIHTTQMSEETAAIIIQRSLRKLFTEKNHKEGGTDGIPIVPHFENIYHSDEHNDNVSEAASYTSASTVQMSAESAGETTEREILESGIIVSEEQAVIHTIEEGVEQQNDSAAEPKKTTDKITNSLEGKVNKHEGVDKIMPPLIIGQIESQIVNSTNKMESLDGNGGDQIENEASAIKRDSLQLEQQFTQENNTENLKTVQDEKYMETYNENNFSTDANNQKKNVENDEFKSKFFNEHDDTHNSKSNNIKKNVENSLSNVQDHDENIADISLIKKGNDNDEQSKVIEIHEKEAAAIISSTEPSDFEDQSLIQNAQENLLSNSDEIILAVQEEVKNNKEEAKIDSIEENLADIKTTEDKSSNIETKKTEGNIQKVETVVSEAKQSEMSAGNYQNIAAVNETIPVDDNHKLNSKSQKEVKISDNTSIEELANVVKDIFFNDNFVSSEKTQQTPEEPNDSESEIETKIVKEQKHNYSEKILTTDEETKATNEKVEHLHDQNIETVSRDTKEENKIMNDTELQELALIPETLKVSDEKNSVTDETVTQLHEQETKIMPHDVKEAAAVVDASFTASLEENKTNDSKDSKENIMKEWLLKEDDNDDVDAAVKKEKEPQSSSKIANECVDQPMAMSSENAEENNETSKNQKQISDKISLDKISVRDVYSSEVLERKTNTDLIANENDDQNVENEKNKFVAKVTSSLEEKQNIGDMNKQNGSILETKQTEKLKIVDADLLPTGNIDESQYLGKSTNQKSLYENTSSHESSNLKTTAADDKTDNGEPNSLEEKLTKDTHESTTEALNENVKNLNKQSTKEQSIDFEIPIADATNTTTTTDENHIDKSLVQTTSDSNQVKISEIPNADNKVDNKADANAADTVDVLLGNNKLDNANSMKEISDLKQTSEEDTSRVRRDIALVVVNPEAANKESDEKIPENRVDTSLSKLAKSDTTNDVKKMNIIDSNSTDGHQNSDEILNKGEPSRDITIVKNIEVLTQPTTIDPLREQSETSAKFTEQNSIQEEKPKIQPLGETENGEASEDGTAPVDGVMKTNEKFSELKPTEDNEQCGDDNMRVLNEDNIISSGQTLNNNFTIPNGDTEKQLIGSNAASTSEVDHNDGAKKPTSIVETTTNLENISESIDELQKAISNETLDTIQSKESINFIMKAKDLSQSPDSLEEKNGNDELQKTNPKESLDAINPNDPIHLATKTGNKIKSVHKNLDAMAYDTSTATPNSFDIGTQNSHESKNENDIISASSEQVKVGKSKIFGNSSNFKNTKKSSFITGQQHEPLYAEIHLKSFNRPNLLDSASVKGILQQQQQQAEQNELKSLESATDKTADAGDSKLLKFNIVESNEIENQKEAAVKPQENERTATYLYGIHTPRNTPTLGRKNSQKTGTTFTIPSDDNHAKKPTQTKQVEEQVALANSDDNAASNNTEKTEKVNQGETDVKGKPLNDAETNDYSKLGELNKNSLENVSNAENEIELESPTKLFAELSIFEDKELDATITAEEAKILKNQNTKTKVNIESVDSSKADNDAFSTPDGILRTIVEINESELPQHSEKKISSEEIIKQNMINVLSEPFDPLEFGSNSDNESDLTSSWTCSKETDENVFSDEFLNENTKEDDDHYIRCRSSVITAGNDTLQGGIYEMDPNNIVSTTNVESKLEESLHEDNTVANISLEERLNVTAEPIVSMNAKDQTKEPIHAINEEASLLGIEETIQKSIDDVSKLEERLHGATTVANISLKKRLDVTAEPIVSMTEKDQNNAPTHASNKEAGLLVIKETNPQSIEENKHHTEVPSSLDNNIVDGNNGTNADSMKAQTFENKNLTETQEVETKAISGESIEKLKLAEIGNTSSDNEYFKDPEKNAVLTKSITRQEDVKVPDFRDDCMKTNKHEEEHISQTHTAPENQQRALDSIIQSNLENDDKSNIATIPTSDSQAINQELIKLLSSDLKEHDNENPSKEQIEKLHTNDLETKIIEKSISSKTSKQELDNYQKTNLKTIFKNQPDELKMLDASLTDIDKTLTNTKDDINKLAQKEKDLVRVTDQSIKMHANVANKNITPEELRKNNRDQQLESAYNNEIMHENNSDDINISKHKLEHKKIESEIDSQLVEEQLVKPNNEAQLIVGNVITTDAKNTINSEDETFVVTKDNNGQLTHFWEQVNRTPNQLTAHSTTFASDEKNNITSDKNALLQKPQNDNENNLNIVIPKNSDLVQDDKLVYNISSINVSREESKNTNDNNDKLEDPMNTTTEITSKPNNASETPNPSPMVQLNPSPEDKLNTTYTTKSEVEKHKDVKPEIVVEQSKETKILETPNLTESKIKFDDKENLRGAKMDSTFTKQTSTPKSAEFNYKPATEMVSPTNNLPLNESIKLTLNNNKAKDEKNSSKTSKPEVEELLNVEFQVVEEQSNKKKILENLESSSLTDADKEHLEATGKVLGATFTKSIATPKSAELKHEISVLKESEVEKPLNVESQIVEEEYNTKKVLENLETSSFTDADKESLKATEKVLGAAFTKSTATPKSAELKHEISVLKDSVSPTNNAPLDHHSTQFASNNSKSRDEKNSSSTSEPEQSNKKKILENLETSSLTDAEIKINDKENLEITGKGIATPKSAELKHEISVLKESVSSSDKLLDENSINNISEPEMGKPQDITTEILEEQFKITKAKSKEIADDIKKLEGPMNEQTKLNLNQLNNKLSTESLKELIQENQQIQTKPTNGNQTVSSEELENSKSQDTMDNLNILLSDVNENLTNAAKSFDETFVNSSHEDLEFVEKAITDLKADAIKLTKLEELIAQAPSPPTSEPLDELTDNFEHKDAAATTIQKYYKGYRVRHLNKANEKPNERKIDYKDNAFKKHNTNANKSELLEKISSDSHDDIIRLETTVSKRDKAQIEQIMKDEQTVIMDKARAAFIIQKAYRNYVKINLKNLKENAEKNLENSNKFANAAQIIQKAYKNYKANKMNNKPQGEEPNIKHNISSEEIGSTTENSLDGSQITVIFNGKDQQELNAAKSESSLNTMISPLSNDKIENNNNDHITKKRNIELMIPTAPPMELHNDIHEESHKVNWFVGEEPIVRSAPGSNITDALVTDNAQVVVETSHNLLTGTTKDACNNSKEPNSTVESAKPSSVTFVQAKLVDSTSSLFEPDKQLLSNISTLKSSDEIVSAAAENSKSVPQETVSNPMNALEDQNDAVNGKSRVINQSLENDPESEGMGIEDSKKINAGKFVEDIDEGNDIAGENKNIDSTKDLGKIDIPAQKENFSNNNNQTDKSMQEQTVGEVATDDIKKNEETSKLPKNADGKSKEEMEPLLNSVVEDSNHFENWNAGDSFDNSQDMKKNEEVKTEVKDANKVIDKHITEFLETERDTANSDIDQTYLNENENSMATTDTQSAYFLVGKENLSQFINLERKYWESDIPYTKLEEPCSKKTVYLVEPVEDETTQAEAPRSESSLSALPTVDLDPETEQSSTDSLESMTKKLHDADVAIERMQLRRASTARSNSNDDGKSAHELSFDEPVIKSMQELQENRSSELEDEEAAVILNRLQREDTRESSAQSDAVVFGEDNSPENNFEYEFEDSPMMKISLQRVHTIAGDDPKSLFKSVTIDDTVQYIEPPDCDTTATSGSSFCLDDDVSENIRKKMMAYSLSEADSDFFDNDTSPRIGKQKLHKDDFNISTALVDLAGTSTETESTIVSAATKIQAGARGFLTRKRLRRSSVGTKSTLPDNSKASFGNAAISESLERLIEEEAAKKIQHAYRKHYRQRDLNTSMAGENFMDKRQKTNADDEEDAHVLLSFESSLAARRLTLQRGDALRNDSTPDEDNGNGNVKQQRDISNESDKESKQQTPNVMEQSIDKSSGTEGSSLENNSMHTHPRSEEIASSESIEEEKIVGSHQITAHPSLEANVAVGKTVDTLEKSSTSALTADANNKNKIDNELKWISLRQNSMPVQIEESEVFRVIPKHMRKRIQSAESQKKKHLRVLRD